MSFTILFQYKSTFILDIQNVKFYTYMSSLKLKK